MEGHRDSMERTYFIEILSMKFGGVGGELVSIHTNKVSSTN